MPTGMLADTLPWVFDCSDVSLPLTDTFFDTFLIKTTMMQAPAKTLFLKSGFHPSKVLFPIGVTSNPIAVYILNYFINQLSIGFCFQRNNIANEQKKLSKII
jgi:hypothetical protein